MSFTRTVKLPGEGFYAQIPNHWIRDHRMPATAFKVLSFWNSHELGYTVGMQQTLAEIKEGRDAIYNAVRWLVDNHYLQRRQHRDGGGKFVGEIEYELGPAAYEQDYIRAWGGADRKRMKPQVTPLPENPEADEATNETAGQTASWKSGYGSAVNGSTGSGESGHIRRTGFKNTKDLENQPPPTVTAPVPAPRPGSSGGGGGDSSPEEPQNDDPDVSLRAVAREVLERVQDESRVGRRRLRGQPASNLAARIAARIAAGWTPDDIVEALSGSFDGADSVVAAMGWRVDNLLDGDPPADRTAAPRDLPPPLPGWCGECESDGYRWRSDDIGRPYKCPECNPSVKRTAAA